MGNTNVVDMNIKVPRELYASLVRISSIAKSDLNSDLVHLFECYVDTENKSFHFQDSVPAQTLGYE